MSHKLFYTLLALATFSLHRTVGEREEDTWIEPSAWGRESVGWSFLNVENNCPVCDADNAKLEDGVALIYYKKLITTLFRRETLQLKKDPIQYMRTLSFTLLPDQLEKLEQLSDPRDLDAVVMEIFATARTSNAYANNVDSSMGITAIVLDILKDSFELLKISEIQFSLIVASVVLFCWYLHKRHDIGYITLVLGSIFLFGFFFTYLDCNRKLEIDEVTEYLSLATKQDSKSSWYSLKRWFGSEENQHINQFKKNRNLKMRFCRPDHVLIMYLNDLFMKQLESVIEKFTTSAFSLSSNLSFPMNLLAPVLLFTFIGYVMKLTYKYILSPTAWASLWHSYQQHPYVHQGNGAHAIAEDRISGENLKLLLNAIKPPALVVTNRPGGAAVSGVQEVLEQIEANPTSINENLVKPLSKDNNNVECEETLNIVALSDSLDDSEEDKH